jgi:hypothetical protein
VPEDAGLDIDFDNDTDPAADADAFARQQATAHFARQQAAADADAELAAVQLAVAAADPDTAMDGEPATLNGKAQGARTITLNGKKFRIAKSVGLMPMLKFSAYADMETQDPRALGAMYAMLRDVIDPADWRDFEDHAVDSKADADELLDVITKAMQLIAGRPTEPPVPSSPGRRAISGGSTGSSSAKRARGSRR